MPTADAHVDAPAVVVGAAILDAGRLLAARRVRPTEARGRWELPGGKVEPGESPAAAAVREIREELGCAVVVTRMLDEQVAIRPADPDSPGLVLRVAVARLASGEPVPHEHDALWWLRADELSRVDWLEPDRPFLTALAPLMEADR